jgi:helicase MOV-10
MNTKRYLQNPEYDNRYVSQLLDNYRSHTSILQFSNFEFYDGKLRAKSKSEDVMLGMKWNQLPNNKFPILFHPCKAPSKKANDGVSTINYGQAEIVKSYVDNLLKRGIDKRKITENDIGVVTPYKAQKDVLKRMLPSKVEIGTSEYYQGREKLIIIFSTVKSKTKGVGFLSDARRLNVCLTRAKALMIVIGNPETLKQDELWKRFVEFCVSNKAFISFNNKACKATNDKKTRKAPIVNAEKSSSTSEEEAGDIDKDVNVPLCLSIIERLKI